MNELTLSNQRIFDNYINNPLSYLIQVRNNLKKAEKNKDIENILFALFIEGFIYVKINNNSKAENIARKAVELGKSTDFNLQKGNAHRLMTVVYNQTSRFEEALKYSAKALKYYTQANDKGGLADTYSNRGESYMFLSHYNEALREAFISLEHNLAIDREKGMVYSYYSIGTIHYMMKNLEQAENYLLKSVELNKKVNNKNLEMLSYTVLGGLALETPKIDEAIEYITKGQNLAHELGAHDVYINSFISLGQVYFQIPNYEETYRHFLKAFNESKKIEQIQISAVAAVNLAQVCLKIEKYNEVIKWVKISIHECSKIKNKQYALYAYLFLNEAYIHLNEPILAQTALIEYDSLNQNVGSKELIENLKLKTKKMEEELNKKQMDDLLEKKKQFLSEKEDFKNKFNKLSDAQQSIMLHYAAYKKPLEISELTRYSVETIKTYRSKAIKLLGADSYEEAVVKINLYIISPIW